MDQPNRMLETKGQEADERNGMNDDSSLNDARSCNNGTFKNDGSKARIF